MSCHPFCSTGVVPRCGAGLLQFDFVFWLGVRHVVAIGFWAVGVIGCGSPFRLIDTFSFSLLLPFH